MATLTILSFIFGAALGMRFKVLVLVPSIGAILFCVFGIGIASGHGFWPIVLGAASAVTAIQIGYLFGAMTRFVVASTRTAHLGGVFHQPLPASRPIQSD